MSKKIIMVGLIIGLVMGGGVILMGEPILSLFDFTPEGAVYAKKILMVYGATLWLTLYNAMHVTGTLRGGGDTRFAMLTETGTVWLIGVPLAFLTSLYLHWPDLHCGAGSEKRRGCESHDTDKALSEQKMAQKCHRKHCPIGEQRFRKKSAKSYIIFKKHSI